MQPKLKSKLKPKREPVLLYRPMGAPTVSALQESIAHWHRLLTGADQELSSAYCALCDKFRRPVSNWYRCARCPVFRRSGLRDCKGTPYIEVALLASHRLRSRDLKSSEWRTACAAELAFLKSLLPPPYEPAHFPLPPLLVGV